MFKRALALPVVIAAGLAVAAPAGAADGPAAKASGDPPAPALPSLVQTRLTRIDKALERLTEDVNETDAVHAPKAGKVVRRQLAAAWRGARYYIVHAPPPPVEDARAGARRHGVRVRDLAPKVRAKIAQEEDDAATIADPVTTAMAVFDTFHNVSSTVIELTDGARVPVLDAMSRTLFLSLDRRDKAIEDVHLLAPPPAEEDAFARAAQDDELPTFDVAMPGLNLWLDDEVLHIDGLQSDAADLRPGGKRILTKGRDQIVATQARINQYWPPETED